MLTARFRSPVVGLQLGDRLLKAPLINKPLKVVEPVRPTVSEGSVNASLPEGGQPPLGDPHSVARPRITDHAPKQRERRVMIPNPSLDLPQASLRVPDVGGVGIDLSKPLQNSSFAANFVGAGQGSSTSEHGLAAQVRESVPGDDAVGPRGQEMLSLAFIGLRQRPSQVIGELGPTRSASVLQGAEQRLNRFIIVTE